MAGEQCPTPFLTKTYQLVDDPAVDGLIAWNDDGTKFSVSHQREFARDLLPQYFKHSNFSSFVRQLYTHGFKKVRGKRCEFFHKLFQRGKEAQLRHIKRKISPAIPLSCAAVQELRDEIEKLKKENETLRELKKENETLKGVNMQMSHELSQLRELCKVKSEVKSEPSECRDFLGN